MARREGRKSTRNMWIFCEGEKTERLYFEKLRINQRIPRLSIKIYSSRSDKAVNRLLEYTIKFMEHHKRDFRTDDLIFCIFDRDSNTNNDFQKAINTASKHNIGLIFSNPSFEYWILCHFGYFPNRFEKETLLRKIENFISNYQKNDPTLYERTIPKIRRALINSKQIAEIHLDSDTELISTESNPCTTVFEIIDIIEDFK
jgi:hypothetical protein